jgi:hypothetical protein
MFDELVDTKFTGDGKSVVSRRFITDEEQLAQIELTEASAAFTNAIAGRRPPESLPMWRRHGTLRVKLVNLFLARNGSDLVRQAWHWYRRRLLYHHRAEG